jgi:hypothetical protein
MMQRRGLLVWGAGALTGVLTVWTSLAGCQGDGAGATSSSSESTQGTGGSTGSTGGLGGGTSTSSSDMTGGSTSSGGPMSTPATVKDVTTGVVGAAVKVKLTGVVAMSQKFLVSKGSTSGSCLWGIFVSDPGLKETAPNTGTMVLSYGTNAVIPDGGTTAFCPRLGIDPIGDKIPDDTKPGDVLDVSGETSYFLLSQCAKEMNGSTVAQYQIAKATSVTKTGTAPVPAAHLLTAAELAKLASPTDKDFHNQWGGVKVKIADVSFTPQMVKDPKTGNMVPSVVDGYGDITTTTGLKVGDNIYYRGYSKDKNFCYNGPNYTAPFPDKFTAIEGFSYLDYCTWSLQPNDKCADLAPVSANPLDCNGKATACSK